MWNGSDSWTLFRRDLNGVFSLWILKLQLCPWLPKPTLSIQVLSRVDKCEQVCLCGRVYNFCDQYTSNYQELPFSVTPGKPVHVLGLLESSHWFSLEEPLCSFIITAFQEPFQCAVLTVTPAQWFRWWQSGVSNLRKEVEWHLLYHISKITFYNVSCKGFKMEALIIYCQSRIVQSEFAFLLGAHCDYSVFFFG